VPPDRTDSSAQRARSGFPLLDPDRGAVRFQGLVAGSVEPAVHNPLDAPSERMGKPGPRPVWTRTRRPNW
jgi:hypothetical protein